jgi:hypothetical protein
VLFDGRSLVPRNEFERRAEGAAAPEAVALDTAWRVRPTDVPAPMTTAPAAVTAEVMGECPSRLRVSLADGSQTCLTGHAISERRTPGLFASVARSVPSGGAYNLAVPSPAGQCPAVVGWAYSTGSGSGGGSITPNFLPEARAKRALDQCRGEMEAAGAAAHCRCVLLVADGLSPFGRAEFSGLAKLSPPAAVPDVTSQMAAAPVSVSVTVPLVAPAITPTTAPSTARLTPPVVTAGLSTSAPNNKPAVAVPPLTVAPVSATSQPAPTGATSAELSALRDQLMALQTLISRQQAAAAAVPALPVVAARPKLRARALIIGNGKYANLGTLPNPPNDARAMAAKLKQFGIEVDLVLDADRSALVRALSDYQARAAGYDVNILFYAGHGLQVDGINYVVPVEMVAAGVTTGSVKLNAVSLNDALEYLPARTRVVFLDACRDNPLSRSLRASRSGISAGLAPVNATSGTLVAYATRDGSTAEDGRGGNSPYTSALLEHLDAEEDIAIVLRRVRQAVLSSTDKRQEPWEYGSLVGDQLVLSRLAR